MRSFGTRPVTGQLPWGWDMLSLAKRNHCSLKRLTVGEYLTMGSHLGSPGLQVSTERPAGQLAMPQAPRGLLPVWASPQCTNKYHWGFLVWV